jgi:hypothetical protein
LFFFSPQEFSSRLPTRPRDSAPGLQSRLPSPARAGHSPGTLDSPLPPCLTPHARPSPDSRLPRALGTRPGPSTPHCLPPSLPTHAPVPTPDCRARWALARDPRLPIASLPHSPRTPQSRLPTAARAGHSPGTLDSRLPRALGTRPGPSAPDSPALDSRARWALARDPRLPTPHPRLPRALGTRPGPSAPDSPALDSRAGWALARGPRLPAALATSPGLPTPARADLSPRTLRPRLLTPDSRGLARSLPHAPGVGSRESPGASRESRLAGADSRLRPRGGTSESRRPPPGSPREDPLRVSRV